MATIEPEPPFSKSKAMELPRSVVIGHDAIQQVGEVVAKLKLGRRALVVADPTTMKVAGETVVQRLQSEKLKVSEYLIPDSTLAAVREAEELVRAGDIDFALGVGGGKSIDVAKCASFNAGAHFVSVPTAASHDGVVSSRASITGDGGEKLSLVAQTPVAVVLGSKGRSQSPVRLLGGGCGGNPADLPPPPGVAARPHLPNEDQ